MTTELDCPKSEPEGESYANPFSRNLQPNSDSEEVVAAVVVATKFCKTRATTSTLKPKPNGLAFEKEKALSKKSSLGCQGEL
jgi:hypothetical protein